VTLGESDVLVVVDMQNDFCPGGRLPVRGGDEIVPLVNALIERAPHVVLTQDWHPPGHASFASAHPGAAPYDQFDAVYGPQTLWPDHCVQGTDGAAFHPALVATKAELIVRKGFHHRIDSYSAFFENDRATPTGLGGYLRERGFRRVFLAGLAFDYCVAWSAEDARRLGFETVVIEDACRAIDVDRSRAEAVERLDRAGAVRLPAASL
jgi:nicotinamidase/pyrazinamidase